MRKHIKDGKISKTKKISKTSLVNLYKHIEFNESYAIKKISIERVNEEDIKKLKKEENILKQINCYYVIKCYDLFIENLNLYFVLESK